MTRVITVVIPTVAGREVDFARCVAAYRQRSVHELRIVTLHDMPTCGEAWNAGAEQANGDYLHFTADDLEPHRGWDVAAVAAADAGELPAPRIVRPDGRLDYCGVHGRELPDGMRVSMSVIPFMTMAQWQAIGPVLPVHYFSDNWISWRGRLAGFPTVVRRAFAFTHHWATAGRGAGMTYEQRMAHDRKIFDAAVAGAAVG